MTKTDPTDVVQRDEARTKAPRGAAALRTAALRTAALRTAAPRPAAPRPAAPRANLLAAATLLAAAALGAALAPGAAHAQDRAGQNRSDQDVTRYEFDDQLVPGDLVRPDGEVFHARRRSARRTLIRARESFVADLYKSVESF